MAFAGISYLAVIVAAVAAFAFGAAWYGLLGKLWMAAVGMTEQPRPTPAPFVISFVALLVMAWTLAGIVGHVGVTTVWGGVVSGFFAWLGFVATTLVVNHRFQGSPWSLSLIDGGHWLGVLLIMGLVERGERPPFRPGRNIAVKLPERHYAQTLGFYRDVLGPGRARGRRCRRIRRDAAASRPLAASEPDGCLAGGRDGQCRSRAPMAGGAGGDDLPGGGAAAARLPRLLDRGAGGDHPSGERRRLRPSHSGRARRGFA
jgi:hypothetical protein